MLHQFANAIRWQRNTILIFFNFGRNPDFHIAKIL
jgi:hypothetical protein